MIYTLYSHSCDYPDTLLWFFGLMTQFPLHEHELEQDTLFFTHPHRLLQIPFLHLQLTLLHGLDAPTVYWCASPNVHCRCADKSKVPSKIRRFFTDSALKISVAVISSTKLPAALQNGQTRYVVR
jgi:hypothetical protein